MATRYPGLGGRIKRAYQHAGLKRAHVAKKLGVDPSTIFQWEKDVSVPKAANIAALASLVGTTVETLLGGPNGVAIDNPDREWQQPIQSAVESYLQSNRGAAVPPEMAAQLRDPANWGALRDISDLTDAHVEALLHYLQTLIWIEQLRRAPAPEPANPRHKARPARLQSMPPDRG